MTNPGNEFLKAKGYGAGAGTTVAIATTHDATFNAVTTVSATHTMIANLISNHLSTTDG